MDLKAVRVRFEAACMCGDCGHVFRETLADIEPLCAEVERLEEKLDSLAAEMEILQATTASAVHRVETQEERTEFLHFMTNFLLEHQGPEVDKLLVEIRPALAFLRGEAEWEQEAPRWLARIDDHFRKTRMAIKAIYEHKDDGKQETPDE